MLIVEKLIGGYLKGQPVLEGLSLELKTGERLLITGENGAGKTTFVRALAGELPWLEGDLTLGKTALHAMTTWKRCRAGLGFFMQGAEVFSRLTGEENIRIATDKGGKALLAEMLPWLVGRLPLLSQQAFRGKAGNYSGGERAQLALAITLASRPGLIVLDEPFAGLSGANLQAVAQTISDYNNDFGNAMILIEQNIPIASGICNRKAVLKKKQLFAE
jgi:ABC-type branched-subunit amino acid transport system ATPase component